MHIRIGTRSSKLAMIQAMMVKDRLDSLGIETEVKGFTSKGDINLDSPLYSIGGTGVFVDDLNRMILKNEIDIAVHSAKDIPSFIDDSLEISAVLKRDDPRDVLISQHSLNDLEASSVIGTSSLRRIKELKTLRNDILIKDLRGNIDTRLKKLDNGDYDGIIMAKAAYDRMKINRRHFILNYDDFVPAPNQGIIAIISKKDSEINDVLKKINDDETYNDMKAERLILSGLNLGCSKPVGIYAHKNRIFMRFYSLKNDDYKDIVMDYNNIDLEFIRSEIHDYGY
ncbi:hydroxymethylbilane synthase [Picrophilus oshimae]|uniref:Probable porphobilinogen deaminase n=1 Tax=Picrophilus torridus (strain ATCC 700027 / DSM 9790 / JCM 10055 / NBRC 100828 / KAW 2/3) TaxID=1122961 RepID=A0A8G2FXZ0_PICTO|nr:hydroxymethylbilane synthase [Picrophilus oshimae]SMD31594.1 hydroxymethylbilane synthase [Picrophilus oshimae DSM 9789]